jgi:hypothetical protein
MVCLQSAFFKLIWKVALSQSLLEERKYGLDLILDFVLPKLLAIVL